MRKFITRRNVLVFVAVSVLSDVLYNNTIIGHTNTFEHFFSNAVLTTAELLLVVLVIARLHNPGAS